MTQQSAAIIGCGRVVQAGHGRGFRALANRVDVVAIADPVPGNLETVGASEQGGPPALSIDAGLHTLAVIMACYESARSDGAGQATDVQSRMMPAFREE